MVSKPKTSLVHVSVIKHLPQGLSVELENGQRGIVRLREISWAEEDIANWRSNYPVGRQGTALSLPSQKGVTHEFSLRLVENDLWDIGGIKLSYVGSIDETFANFISTQTINKIEQSLEQFFLQIWSDHYSQAKDKSTISLFSLYCEVWDRDWYNRAIDFTIPNPSDSMGSALWQMARSRNPLDRLKSIAENEGTENDPSRVKETRIAVTHGNLDADNLLVDNSQQGWVVDFERSGEGHALQDFIELESDIITRIACAREEFPAFYRFCLAIASAHTIDEIPHDSSFLMDETQKLLDTIVIIRRLAVQCTKITDARQYLLGLYFNTIFRATITLKEQSQKSDLRAWMLASILCHRLACWNDPWPLDEWKNLI